MIMQQQQSPFTLEVYRTYAENLGEHLREIHFTQGYKTPEDEKAALELASTLDRIAQLLHSEDTTEQEQGITQLIELRGAEAIAQWHTANWEKIQREIQEDEFYAADRSICPELWRDPREGQYEEKLATHTEVPYEFDDFVDPSFQRLVTVLIQ